MRYNSLDIFLIIFRWFVWLTPLQYRCAAAFIRKGFEVKLHKRTFASIYATLKPVERASKNNDRGRDTKPAAPAMRLGTDGVPEARV